MAITNLKRGKTMFKSSTDFNQKKKGYEMYIDGL